MKPKKSMKVTVTLTLDDETVQALHWYCNVYGAKMSTVVNKMIKEKLADIKQDIIIKTKNKAR